MQAVSFKRHRFPPDVIRQAVWLYFRFILSLRDVEEMLAVRDSFRSREQLKAEIIVLRHQLNVLQRKMPKRPQLSGTD